MVEHYEFSGQWKLILQYGTHVHTLKCLKWKRKRILNVGWNVEKPKHPSAVVGV